MTKPLLGERARGILIVTAQQQTQVNRAALDVQDAALDAFWALYGDDKQRAMQCVASIMRLNAHGMESGRLVERLITLLQAGQFDAAETLMGEIAQQQRGLKG